MKTKDELYTIAKQYVRPFRHNLPLGEEAGFINDLVSFAEHLQNLYIEDTVRPIDLEKELQNRIEIVYIQGIEHSVVIFNDAKEIAEIYAEQFKKNQ